MYLRRHILIDIPAERLHSPFNLELACGVKARESGDYDRALTHFGKALKISNTYSERRSAWAHVYLTYMQKRDYVAAEHAVNRVLRFSRLLRDKKSLCEGLRHHGKFMLEVRHNLERADYDATTARSLAIDLGRRDLCWFTHLVLQVREAQKVSVKELREWATTEMNEYFTLGLKDPNVLAKRAWLRSLLRDLTAAYGLFGPLVYAWRWIKSL